MLLCFNCVYEATTCVCAANIGTHARAAAAAAAAPANRRGRGRRWFGGEGGELAAVEDSSSDTVRASGGSIIGRGEIESRDDDSVSGNGDDECIDDDDDGLLRSPATSVEEALGGGGGGVTAVYSHRLSSSSSSSHVLDSFGGDITALFVALSAAGYLAETLMQSSIQVAGGEMSLPLRFALHGALLLVVGCALGIACFLLRRQRRRRRRLGGGGGVSVGGERRRQEGGTWGRGREDRAGASGVREGRILQDAAGLVDEEVDEDDDAPLLLLDEV